MRRHRGLEAHLNAVLLALGLLTGACSIADSPITNSGDPGSRTSIQGDWDDVDAAVSVASGQVEMAVIEVRDVSTDQRVFELMTIGDQLTTLTVTRAGRSDELLIEARVGRFGDPGREQKLLSRVRARLEQLRGRDVAPL